MSTHLFPHGMLIAIKQSTGKMTITVLDDRHAPNPNPGVGSSLPNFEENTAQVLIQEPGEEG